MFQSPQSGPSRERGPHPTRASVAVRPGAPDVRGLHGVVEAASAELHPCRGDRPALRPVGVHAEGTGEAAPGQGRRVASAARFRRRPQIAGAAFSPCSRWWTKRSWRRSSKSGPRCCSHSWCPARTWSSPRTPCFPTLSPAPSLKLASNCAARSSAWSRPCVAATAKGAHDEFAEVSAMPRSMWEPWLVFRKPLQGRVQDNLRRWRCGGFRRPDGDRPFGDVIQSAPTRKGRGRWHPTRT